MCESSMLIAIRTAVQMRARGSAIARALPPTLAQPLFIALYGDLGAGKTTLVSGALEALGVASHARSPTYTLIEPYEAAQVTLYHLDLYRLGAPADLEMLGVRDLLNSQSVLFIEWPERGAGFLPTPSLVIRIVYAGEDAREVTLQAEDRQGQELLSVVKSQVSSLSS
jgi:tRNA threonylcarbamoyladenosine biosynthesis protein TsaE